MDNNVNEARNTDDEKIISARLAAFCEKSGCHLSPDADSMIKDMVQMKRRFGDFFCPCQPQQIRETICICKPVRNGMVDILGACFCGLIIAGKE